MTASSSPAAVPSAPAPLPADVLAGGPVRVLFVNDTARNGGPGRSLHSILRFLDPSAVHRAVVLPRNGAIAELLTRDGVADELVFEPDLVYCNGTNADFAGGALATLTGVPALWHVRYTSVPAAVGGLHRRLSASRGVRRIVCVSHAAAALFPHCPDKVQVIHNALDVGDFDPQRVTPSLRAELGIAPDTLVLGSHGRVLRRKGYVEMILAARRALDAMTGAERARVAFVVVGDTPEDFRPDHLAECRALAAATGMAGQFHMPGFRADVRSSLADFDVAVVPSVYADPLPRSVIESMAMARPVIAFDVGGVAEMLDETVGELVPFEAAGEGASDAAVARLARAMLRYVRDAGLRARQGQAARLRVLRDFDARAHALRIQGEILRAAGPRIEAP